MKQVLITSDSTTDLGSELIARCGVRILPLKVALGDTYYTDGVDITPEDIYAHYEKTGELPRTAAPNIADTEDFFRRCTQEGYAVVHFTISSEMSSSYSNARLAAENFPDVHVVDTRNLSTGGGLLVLRAHELAAQGLPAQEIAQRMEALIPRVDASFVVDDLEFLHKGGRCSALAAFGANVLQLRPCIVVRDGKMGVGTKYRGKFAKILPRYILERIGDGSGIEPGHIFITHAGCDEAVWKPCVELLEKMGIFGEIHVTRAGCTISSHCGRNTLGVLFIRKQV